MPLSPTCYAVFKLSVYIFISPTESVSLWRKGCLPRSSHLSSVSLSTYLIHFTLVGSSSIHLPTHSICPEGFWVPKAILLSRVTSPVLKDLKVPIYCLQIFFLSSYNFCKVSFMPLFFIFFFSLVFSYSMKSCCLIYKSNVTKHSHLFISICVRFVIIGFSLLGMRFTQHILYIVCFSKHQ